MIMEKKEHQLLTASTILFILNVSASALNYLCQLVMARVLSVESYGTVNTIFAFMMIVAVPGTTLTMIAAKYYSSDNPESNKRIYLRKQLNVVSLLTIGVFLALLIGSNLFTSILSIQDSVVLGFTFALAALGYFQPLYSGVFSGNKCFIFVGIYSMTIPLYKLLAIGGAYFYSTNDTLRLYILLGLMICGTIATAIIGHIKAQNVVGKIKKEDSFQGSLYSKNDFYTLILNISLMLYMNIDLLAVRHYGAEAESGLYSCVLLFGRIIYYFATTLGTILLPSVATSQITDQKRLTTLNKTLILMGIFAIVCMLPVNIWKLFFIQLLYGTDYLPAAKYVIYVCVISLSLSVLTIMVNYVVGVGKTRLAACVMAVIDVLLIINIVILENITLILLSIGVIGIIGALIIYFTVNRNADALKTKD